MRPQLDYGFPRKGRFSDADVEIKKPGYTFAKQVENMSLKTGELVRLIDMNDDGVIMAQEFVEVVSSFGDFTEDEVAEMSKFLLPKGQMSVQDFAMIIDSLMDDYALFKIKRAQI